MTDEEQLRELFLTQFGLDEADLSPDLAIDELALNSLQMLELVVAAEDAFDIDLDEEALSCCTTLGEAEAYILNQVHDRK